MDDLALQTLEALRRYAVRYQESAHRLAAAMGLPMTDGAALGEIVWAENAGDPLSASRLRWRVGLTSGATNALVRRLEAQGLVVRSRESTDRRIVTLRATEAARARAAVVVGSRLEDLETAVAEYDPRTLATVRDFVDRFAEILPDGDATVDRATPAPALDA